MTDDPLRIWADAPFAVAQVVEKALAYEEAWTTEASTLRWGMKVSIAREALLEAVRTLRGRYG